MEDCTDSFVKECYIATETVFVPVTVTVCEDVISRRCANALEGDEVCSVEYATGTYGPPNTSITLTEIYHSFKVYTVQRL